MPSPRDELIIKQIAMDIASMKSVEGVSRYMVFVAEPFTRNMPQVLKDWVRVKQQDKLKELGEACKEKSSG